MWTRIGLLLTLAVAGFGGEIGRVTRVVRKPNVRVFSLRESNSVRAVVYTVETDGRIYVGMDLGKKYFDKGYPKQVFTKGQRVQVRVDGGRIEVAPVEGGTWERLELESEEDK